MAGAFFWRGCASLQTGALGIDGAKRLNCRDAALWQLPGSNQQPNHSFWAAVGLYVRYKAPEKGLGGPVHKSMKIIDNIHRLLGDDLKDTLRNGVRLKVAATTFSIFAFDALKAELAGIDGLDFIFTSPTFIPEGAVDQVKRERREFFTPKVEREKNIHGSEFFFS